LRRKPGFDGIDLTVRTGGTERGGPVLPGALRAIRPDRLEVQIIAGYHLLPVMK